MSFGEEAAETPPSVGAAPFVADVPDLRREVRLSRAIGAVGPAVEMLLEPLEELEDCAEVKDRMRLACTELVTNAIEHQPDQPAEDIWLELRLTKPCVLALFHDRGPALPDHVWEQLAFGAEAPDQFELPESGWGLFLATRVVDYVGLRRTEDCTSILLCCQRASDPATAEGKPDLSNIG